MVAHHKGETTIVSRERNITLLKIGSQLMKVVLARSNHLHRFKTIDGLPVQPTLDALLFLDLVKIYKPKKRIQIYK
jgi:hypothetical protein